MSYFKHAFGILTLNDHSYKFVGNNSRSVQEMIIVILLGWLIFVPLLLMYATVYLSEPLFAHQESAFFVALLIILPLCFTIVTFSLTFLFSLIPYSVGALLNGSAKDMIDFFCVLFYPIILYGVLLLFPFGIYLVSIFFVFVTYQTFRIIHRLKLSSSILATVLSLFMVSSLLFVLTLLFL